MKFSNLVRLLLFLAVSCVTACAQESSSLYDASIGASYVHARSSATSGLGTQSLYGGELSLSRRVMRPWLRIVGDAGYNYSGYRSSDIVGLNVGGSQLTFLVGPRLSFPVGRLTPFAQALFGVGHASAGLYYTTTSQWAFAWTAGAGFDYRLSHHFSWRAVQLEFMRTNYSEYGYPGQLQQNNIRASSSIVFHF